MNGHQVERVLLGSVVPHPDNARRGDVATIARSLEEHGQYRPIVVQASTGYIIAGNHTWRAAESLGLAEIDVMRIDVTDDEARRILLVDNRTSDLATYDASLADVLRSLTETDRGLSGTGFDETFLVALEQRLDPAGKIEQTPLADAEGSVGIFHCVVHFSSEEDAQSFFRMIGAKRARAIWWARTGTAEVEREPLLSVQSKEMLPVITRLAEEAGADMSVFTEEARQMLEQRWQRSLAAGTPDLGVYDEDAYTYELWACWRDFSRETLVNITKPTSLPPHGVAWAWGQPSLVVDLGCGFGLTTAVLTELFPEARVIGTNLPGSAQYRMAERLAARYGFTLLESVKGIAGEVDLVLASEYFEHFECPVDHLTSLLAEIQPRTWIIASTFNKPAIGHFESYVVGGQRVDGRTVARRFGDAMRGAGYRKVQTRLWNNRPAVWTRQAE